jgi:hypothetical protein
LGDLFDMQDEIVARLANQLGTELIAAEARRALEAPNPDSVDLYFQGLASFNQGITLDIWRRRAGFLSAAWRSIRTNLDALLGVGRVDANTGASFLSDDRSARLTAAEATIGRVPNERFPTVNG